MDNSCISLRDRYFTDIQDLIADDVCICMLQVLYDNFMLAFRRMSYPHLSPIHALPHTPSFNLQANTHLNTYNIIPAPITTRCSSIPYQRIRLHTRT